MTQQRAPRAEPTPPLSEAELSRIAREAVHQPADPRLDRQLARMGVMDAPASAKGRAELPSAAEHALERINGRLRRIELLVGALVVAVAALSLLTVIQLLR